MDHSWFNKYLKLKLNFQNSTYTLWGTVRNAEKRNVQIILLIIKYDYLKCSDCFFATDKIKLSKTFFFRRKLQIIGYIVLWSFALIVEILIVIVSLKGTILDDEQRWGAEYLLYLKLGKSRFLSLKCLKP